MDIIKRFTGLTGTYKTLPLHAVLLTTILFFDHDINKTNKVASGQAIIPLLHSMDSEPKFPVGNSPILKSFLEPCDIVTLQTQCTEEEYESNEDCLPQKTDNCDHSKELFCLSGVCLPNCHPHKESYSRVEGKCFRKVGSDCKLPNNTASPTTTTTTPNTTMPFIVQQQQDDSEENQLQYQHQEEQQHSTVIVPECETNAICERGQCRCAKNFTYDHNFNKCILYASYARYCNDTISCDRMSDIACKENQCQCKSPTTQYFHLKRKRCYVLIEQVCSTGLQFCPDNSNCMRRRNINYNNNMDGGVIDYAAESISTSTPPDYQLQHQRNISEGYIHDFRLRSLYEEQRNYGGNDDGTENPEDEHFIGILGDDEEEKEFVCKCDKGFGSTRDKRFCLGLHGSRCNTLHRCNMERGLKCFDGVCLCDREKENEQIYSEQFQTCVTRIGAPCIADGKGEKESDICPIGGSCEKEKCVCDGSLMPPRPSASTSSSPPTTAKARIAYSCMKSHGMSCKNNSNIVSTTTTTSSDILSLILQGIYPFEPPCNHEIGLECSAKEGKCVCRDPNQFYDTTQNICRNFYQQVDTKMPVIHFTPPSDREYTFGRSSANKDILFSIEFLFGLTCFLKIAIVFDCKYY